MFINGVTVASSQWNSQLVFRNKFPTKHIVQISILWKLIESCCLAHALNWVRLFLALTVTFLFVMATLHSRHYIFVLFLPYLSDRRLDVYHVALVWILNAGLKCGACGSLKIQDAKSRQKCHLSTIAQLCRAVSSQLRHVSTIGKKLVKQQYLPHMSSQYGEHWPTSCWNHFVSLGHPSKFQWVSRLGSVTAWHSTSRRQPNCGVEQRAPPVFDRAAIRLGIGAHFYFCPVFSSFFPRQISVVADWMSTILLHMVWP